MLFFAESRNGDAMPKIIDAQYLALLETLTLKIRLALKNSQMGQRRSSAKGSSVEFSDYREYMPGDDFRRIDWNALARFEKVFIKLFMEEQESPVSIFVDHSDSMGMYGKRETAAKVASAFAYLALSEYDTTSMVLFDSGIKGQLAGLRGKNSFNRIIDVLESAETSGQTDLYRTISGWQNKFRKGVTVLVSDFLYDHRLEEVMALLAFKKQKIILCHVLGTEELKPVIDENVRLTDSETDRYMNLDAGVAVVNIYERALESYMKEINGLCTKYGAEHIIVDTSQPIENFIRELNRMK